MERVIKPCHGHVGGDITELIGPLFPFCWAWYLIILVVFRRDWGYQYCVCFGCSMAVDGQFSWRCGSRFSSKISEDVTYCIPILIYIRELHCGAILCFPFGVLEP